ncbi:hypothetical protein GCM10007385_40630 [Tateyamaria omphalii]|uniref:beta-ketoacyl [acyl carrier protein] synthase domain-containing protein n=1 Tax=Tateyamaria omphalii TaxID=299262 RepID=UPI0016721C2A|nr:polyketide synthase [Tateyamaria omphalii]GGX67385.1 hypothetical protein GCM10007385_40630 [Tateyamaria omphalii]
MKTETAVAIVGIGLRLPGADTSAGLTKMVANGSCAIDDVPAARWHHSVKNDNVVTGLAHDRAGLVGAIDGIDRRCFRISANEAPMIDPMQRLFLESSWHALEHAGYAPARLEGVPCGVFAGVCVSEYALLQAASWGDHADNPYQNTGASNSLVPGRVAYCLGLTGPVQAIDNACASSMSAVIAAAEALVLGRCEMALAGGVNVLLSKRIFQSLAAMRTLSPRGEYRPFDSEADGYVRGEGCGVVVLKTLDAALEDGDNIHGVLRGWHQRHNGRTNGIHAPSWQAQSEAMRAAMAMAGVTPVDIGYVEAHGSATPLGDMIEARAIQEALASECDRPVSIGSVKAAMGHLEGAAGIAGILKAVTVIKERHIPPQPGFCTAGDKLAAAAPDIQIARTTQPWPNDANAVLVNSLGYNGGCTQMVLTASPARPSAEPSELTGLFLVSAACPDALHARLSQLHTLLMDTAASISVGQLAQAVSMRWDGLAFRFQFWANTREEALVRVEAELATRATPKRIPTSRVQAILDSEKWQDVMMLLSPGWYDALTPETLFNSLGIKLGTDPANTVSLVPCLDETSAKGAKRAVFEAIGRAWLEGVSLNLSALWPSQDVDIDVPPYPFQRTEAWALTRSEPQDFQMD